MVSSISGADNSNSLASIFLAQQLSASNPPTSQGVAGSPDPASGGGTASISGHGQLLSNLEQLQTQNPTAFQQVTTEIANQLSAAAQQAGEGSQGNFLSTLAQKFQNVANGGNLSQLQPHHHHHGAHHAYQQTQDQTQSIAGLSPASSSTATSPPDLQQLFASISSEVSQALGG